MTIVRAKTTTISQQLQPSYAFHHAPWFLLCLWYRWQSKNTNSFQDFHGPEIVLKNLSERTARKIWIGKIFDVDGKVCTGGYAPCTWHRIKDRCLLFATHVPRPSFPSSFIPTNPFINQSIHPFRCILILDIVRMVIVSFEFRLPQEFNEPWSQWDGDRQRTTTTPWLIPWRLLAMVADEQFQGHATTTLMDVVKNVI
jgi:hypothetical protein